MFDASRIGQQSPRPNGLRGQTNTFGDTIHRRTEDDDVCSSGSLADISGNFVDQTRLTSLFESGSVASDTNDGPCHPALSQRSRQRSADQAYPDNDDSFFQR